MNAGRLPFTRYPGLSPLFLEFLRGLPEFFPDPPTIAAAAARGRELAGTRSRVPQTAWRCRFPEAREKAEAMAQGRAVAAVTGHQVGLFTGPLYTLTKAFDALRVAGEIQDQGTACAPVFWALTDDHDLEEVGRTAWPGPTGPEVLALDGSDRSNRSPVGSLPIPERAGQILEAFRAAAKAPDADETLALFSRRYAAPATYADAFMETLLDLTEPEPLLVLDPSHESLRETLAEFFAMAVARKDALHRALAGAAERLERSGRPVPVPFRPEIFPFFLIEGGQRRRVTDPEDALRRVRAGQAWPSTDVLTRPVLKSYLMPTAATVLGAAEIAYHAQSIPLFAVFDLKPPVLLPRSHLILMGPAERRTAEALGIASEDLLSGGPAVQAARVPQADEVADLARSLDERLAGLAASLKELDASLSAALETTRQKAAYPLQQLRDRIQKAAERRDTTAQSRVKKLETMLRPNGTPAERVYPPLVPMLAWGRSALREIRRAARGGTEGAAIVQFGAQATDGGDGNAS
jgi:bacillithiol biosynthesis cysteine-adding enzyme BshC